MLEPVNNSIQNYYDARVTEKLQDFTRPLPRIEAAIQTLSEWAPRAPRRILEIGCGVGATSWRMARAWPEAEVVGTDISPVSIQVAKTCFKRPNLSYTIGSIRQDIFSEEFDLIVMMDVYEHIAPSERPLLHATLSKLLSPESRFILTIPTPANQELARKRWPDQLQPVDEDVGLREIATLAAETSTKLLYYREVGVWHYGDYFHLVLGRYQHYANVALRHPEPKGLAAVRQAINRVLGRATPKREVRYDYLGSDLMRPISASPERRFRVSLSERRRLASTWLGHQS
jgi:SAM-dependent methyltransferase